MALDVKAAERSLARVAKSLGLDLTAAADGILRIAATAMSYAVKGVTTERGLDAGDFALVAYGGAGPLHAVAVAREIGISRVIVPRAPGVFSAFGMLFSDLRYDYVRTQLMRLEDAPFKEIERIHRALEEQGRAAIAATSVTPRSVTVRRALDMRYVGQEHAVTVDIPLKVYERADRAAIKQLFDAQHALRYGTSAPAERAEIVSLRSTITGTMRKPPLAKIKRGTRTPPRAAFAGKRPVWFAGRFRATPAWRRDALLAGNRISGPALIEEHASTTVLMPGDGMEVDGFGNLTISVAGTER
jgi:N-methylhydantoinase A